MVQSPLLRVGGEGWFDLPRQRLDYLLLPASRRLAARTGRGRSRGLVRRSLVPVRIAGSFAQPSYTVLWSQAAESVEADLENTLQNELQKQLAPAQAQPL